MPPPSFFLSEFSAFLCLSLFIFLNLVIIPSLEIKAHLSLLPAVESWQPAGWNAQNLTSSSLFYLILSNHNHHTEAFFLCPTLRLAQPEGLTLWEVSLQIIYVLKKKKILNCPSSQVFEQTLKFHLLD